MWRHLGPRTPPPTSQQQRRRHAAAASPAEANEPLRKFPDEAAKQQQAPLDGPPGAAAGARRSGAAASPAPHLSGECSAAPANATASGSGSSPSLSQNSESAANSTWQQRHVEPKTKAQRSGRAESRGSDKWPGHQRLQCSQPERRHAHKPCVHRLVRMARTVAGQLLTDLLLTYSRPHHSSPPAKARSSTAGTRAARRAARLAARRVRVATPRRRPLAARPRGHASAACARRASPVRAAPHTPEGEPALPSARLVLRETGRMRPLHARAGRERCFAAAYVRLASLPSLAANLQSQERRGVLAMRKGLDAGRWERWASLLQARHMHEHRSHSKRCGQHTREALHAERPSATRAARRRPLPVVRPAGTGRNAWPTRAQSTPSAETPPWVAVPPHCIGARKGGGGGGGGPVGGGRVRARARQEVLQVAAQQAQVGVPLHVARAARQAQRLRAPDPAQAGQATGWPAPGGAGVRVGLGHWTHCPSCAGPWTGDRPARAARRWDSHGFPPRCRSAHWQCPETVDTCTRRAPWRARVGRPAARARERAGRRGARLLDRAERGRQVAAAARARGLGGRLPAAQHVECEPKEEVRQRRQAHVRAARAVHQQPPAVLRPALQLGASRSTICLGRGHVAC